MGTATCRTAVALILSQYALGVLGFCHLPLVNDDRKQCQRFSTTPFEADLYDDSNPYNDDADADIPLAASPDTKLVLGVNKYSHDVTLCAADAATGQVLWALSKERLTRRKHDAGHVATLVEACLASLDLTLDSIVKVVVNNHHHRVLPYEQDVSHLEWQAGLHMNAGDEDGLDEPENLIASLLGPDVQVQELSHHLAHAYSVACQAPFDTGLIVVMDGMGETYRIMRHAVEMQDASYVSDLSFGLNTFQCEPSNIEDLARTHPFDFREAESVYTFEKKDDGALINVLPVFKRFAMEHTPPTLYNHGFENMDSLGALYSRASSHLFGNWNVCGKVMGLAPWAHHTWQAQDSILRPVLHDTPIVSGQLYQNDGLHIDRTLLQGEPLAARNDPDLFDGDARLQRQRYDFDDNQYNPALDAASSSEAADAPPPSTVERLPAKVALDAIAVAHRIQADLETVAMDFVQHFRERTGAANLCLAGGVALNSVLNGRLARELGFDRTFIPSCPGDDGIAVGCCAFGLFGNAALVGTVNPDRPLLWRTPLPAYLGPAPTEQAMQSAIYDAAPWLEVEEMRNDDQRLSAMAQEVASGGIVAWYHGRSELGPRALGHRSILADPRKKGLVRFINESVKRRESFRPFAPSVLAEEAAKWFELGSNRGQENNASPYMSMTAMVFKNKRDLIPAVTHVDGSSRLQTVTKEDEPLYHRFISTFFQLTDVPMVLNTSFNTLPGEPIVETPQDAIRSFLFAMGAIDMLVVGKFVVRRRSADLKRLLGEATKDGDVKRPPSRPRRTGTVRFQSTAELDVDSVQNGSDDVNEDTSMTRTKISMPSRPTHHATANNWFELLDELEGEILTMCDGTNDINDMMGAYTAIPSDQERRAHDVDEAQLLLQNIVHRLVRLYDHNFINW